MGRREMKIKMLENTTKHVIAFLIASAMYMYLIFGCGVNGTLPVQAQTPVCGLAKHPSHQHTEHLLIPE